ncbi:MAG: hypothetical protein GY866_17900 [Proteobacteria bacterium]|nr:hypothetical protein [Pseudomonadota bacterium]
MIEFEYLTDRNGKPKAVVVPIELWRQLLANDIACREELLEELEDYCLSKAMDEAKDSPLLDRKEALEFLEE